MSFTKPSENFRQYNASDLSTPIEKNFLSRRLSGYIPKADLSGRNLKENLSARNLSGRVLEKKSENLSARNLSGRVLEKKSDLSGRNLSGRVLEKKAGRVPRAISVKPLEENELEGFQIPASLFMSDFPCVRCNPVTVGYWKGTPIKEKIAAMKAKFKAAIAKIDAEM